MSIFKDAYQEWRIGWQVVFMSACVILPIVICANLVNGVGAHKGKYVGVVITSDEYNGIIWDSNLVWLKTDVEESEGIVFCVNDEIFPILEQVTGKKIIVYFENDYILWRWNCNGGVSIIWKVEFLENE